MSFKKELMDYLLTPVSEHNASQEWSTQKIRRLKTRVLLSYW